MSKYFKKFYEEIEMLVEVLGDFEDITDNESSDDECYFIKRDFLNYSDFNNEDLHDYHQKK